MKFCVLAFVKKAVSRLYAGLFREDMFRQTRQERERLIRSFPQPQNRVERSYFQYCCHMASTPKLLQWAQNFLAVPILSLLWAGSCRRSFTGESKSERAVYFTDGIGTEIIPDSLRKEFSSIASVDYQSGLFFGERERKWILPVWKKYWKSPYFILKCYVKIGLYAAQIKACQPAALIVYNEYSFTSSLLTEYCHSLGVEHINVLHGERLYNTRDTFVCYHRFYVWSAAYRNLFLAMGAEPAQFRIEQPPLLLLSLPEAVPRYDLTYYLGDQPQGRLLELYRTLEPLRVRGYRVCIRFHPRFGNRRRTREIFSDYFTEEPESVSIADSMAHTGLVCGIASTVLFQALWAGKPVVLDDISDRERFDLLTDLGYTMLGCPHTLLSSIVRPHISSIADKENL